MNQQVDIIIPLYNRPDLIEPCIGRMASTTDVPYRITLIDDASPDPQVNKVMLKFAAKANLMHNRQNLGFGQTVNKAIRSTTSPYVCILNQDTEPLPGWLDVLFEDIEKNRDHGVVAPLLLFHSNSKSGPGGLVQHAGMYFDINKQPRHRYIGWPADNARVQEYRDDLQIVSGACMILRRSVWTMLGGFAPEYKRGTFEDTELCLKIKAFHNVYGPPQLKVCYNPNAILYHHVGASATTVPNGFPIAMNFNLFQSRLGLAAEYDEWLVAS